MDEISLNILDIVSNSIAAQATQIAVTLAETREELTLTVEDDGDGMTPEELARAWDPFHTTRTTRPIGLGLPFLRMEAELTGGDAGVTSFSAAANASHGTRVWARFLKNSVDCPPLGNITDTLCAILCMPGGADLHFLHTAPGGTVTLDTAQMRRYLGDVPLSEPAVVAWARESLCEQYRVFTDSMNELN